tara:strand:+ start:1439 stop:1987 length:549 start_codon:yes stop_codon:yes gene_type:complete
MKTISLENVISSKELFFMYREIVSTAMWSVTGLSDFEDENSWDKKQQLAPVLVVKKDGQINSYPFYLWAKTVVYRIANKLAEKNIGLNTNISRVYLNLTYDNNNQHFLHTDSEEGKFTSIVLFLTPVWLPNWEGGFYVDGEKFDFKPGSAVIFDSRQFHKGDQPKKEDTNWLRLTCNIIVER